MTEILSTVAAELGWEYRSLRNSRLHVLRGPYGTMYVMNYSFPHNSSASAKISNDKVAAFELLHSLGIPAVPHSAVVAIQTNRAEAVETCRKALMRAGLPFHSVVVKPLCGSGGNGVEHCNSLDEGLESLMRCVQDNGGVAAVSPYLNVHTEIRMVLLDGRILVTYEKIRDSDWRHNLSLGATPRIVTDECHPDAADLARRSIAAIGLRVAAVDVVLARPQGWMVLEVNDGIKLDDAFAGQSDLAWRKALAVYREVILAF